MKYLQIVVLKNILILALIFISFTGKAQTAEITKADSLFKAKQYTQSLDIYQKIFRENKYTPAMLLRMAYINEGLGKKGLTLYYLKLYHLATNDDQALQKSEELAAKYKLSGYETNDSKRFTNWFTRNLFLIELFLLVILFAAAAVIFLQKRKGQNPWGAFAGVVCSILVLIYLNNFYSSSYVIISSDQAYLMEGPSAGANVAAIIPEGNLLQNLGREDVWLKVLWLDQVVYVKETAVAKVEL